MITKKFTAENSMNERNTRRISRTCIAGIVNQAVISNVTALLFVPFMRLYGLTYIQFGILTAVGFGAQMLADVVLLFLIDRVPCKILVWIASGLSCAGLVFYGVSPFLFFGQALYFGMVAATIIFAFAGGMLEVVLSNVADSLPEGKGGVSIVLLHTVYAWAQVVLACVLFVFITLFGTARWNILILFLAIVPAGVGISLIGLRFPQRQKREPVRAAFKPFYLFAVAAVFFGYGAEAVMNQWVATFAAESFGEEWGALLGGALFAVCLGMGGAFYELRQRKRSEVAFGALIFGAVCAAGMYFLASMLTSAVAALCCAAACGFFVGILSPGAMTAASESLPHAGGWMLASLAVSQDIGAAILPSAGGAIAQSASIRQCFFVMAAVPLCAAAFLGFMAYSKNRDKNRLLFQRKKFFPDYMRKR